MKSTECKACGNIFIPKWHGRDKACSEPCRALLISKSKLKYSTDQIDHVVALKKKGETNAKISTLTGVKISKVKEIVKENSLFLDRETINRNAYQGKLKRNPNAMRDMREKYHKMARSEESLEKAKSYINQQGYEYVKGFETKTKDFTVRCLKCGKEKSVSRIYTIIKDSCMYCSGSTRTSKAENEIKEWVTSLGVKNEKYKFKKRDGGIEIDIYIPSANLGIEYCGLYWHNEDSPTPRPREYHFGKMMKANHDGIRLITIFGDEWRDRKPQVKNFIKSALGVYEKRIFARKCECRPIDRETANTFLNDAHIQGAGRSIVSFGLFYNDELIGVVSGGRHHRGRNPGALVLNRLAFKDGHQVTGGSSKLLKHLIMHAKKTGYSSVVSWSDNRWSEGNVYNKIGFTLDGQLDPDYSYVYRHSRIPKQSCRKSVLRAKGGIGDTEEEMAVSLGYSKIWDCGKKRWTLTL